MLEDHVPNHGLVEHASDRGHDERARNCSPSWAQQKPGNDNGRTHPTDARSRVHRRCSAASAVGLPQGPADIYVLRRLRVRLERYLASYTRWRHPSFPRRWREPPRPIRCVQTARPSVTISSQPFCPVSPPGCLRACLCLVASRMIGACRSRGGGNRAY